MNAVPTPRALRPLAAMFGVFKALKADMAAFFGTAANVEETETM